jgi:hypothetical protein
MNVTGMFAKLRHKLAAGQLARIAMVRVCDGRCGF